MQKQDIISLSGNQLSPSMLYIPMSFFSLGHKLFLHLPHKGCPGSSYFQYIFLNQQLLIYTFRLSIFLLKIYVADQHLVLCHLQRLGYQADYYL